MTFKAPIQDIRFCLDEIAVLDQVLSMPGFEEVDSDLVDAVLEQNARLVEDVVAPLNRKGDTQAPVWNDGNVTTTPGFAEAFRAYADG